MPNFKGKTRLWIKNETGSIEGVPDLQTGVFIALPESVHNNAPHGNY
jgi:hypothetical protein